MQVQEDFKTRLYEAYASDHEGVSAAQLPAAFQGRAPYLKALFRRWVPADRSTRIFDLGCGNGALLYFLKELGYTNLFGVDVSPEQVALARHLGLNTVVQGDLRLTLERSPEGSADVLFAFDVLEHFTRPDLLEIGDRMARVLAPGGRLILHVPNGAGIFCGFIRYGDLTHELAFTYQSLRQFGNACGLRLEAVAEDTPVPHGLVSTARWLLWKIGTLPVRLLFLAESPMPMSQIVLSQNIQAVFRKK